MNGNKLLQGPRLTVSFKRLKAGSYDRNHTARSEPRGNLALFGGGADLIVEPEKEGKCASHSREKDRERTSDNT